MAGKLLIVVDTNYWVELFKIPLRYTETKHLAIKDKFTWAIEQKATLYFPLPCVYELANHIAHVKDGNKRQDLANQLYKIVKDETVTDKTVTARRLPIPPIPIVVTPACAVNELSVFIERFKDEYVAQGIGLADAAVIDAARHLKNPNNQVYIWTLDISIKAREPDRESNPFTG
jgi:hypothetical protein